MSEAVFALLGALLGILGTLTTELVRSRVEAARGQREAVRVACADFTAALSRMRGLAFELRDHAGDRDLLGQARAANLEARVAYERFRLVTGFARAQEAGRRALRYSFGLLRVAQREPPREDEREQGPMPLIHEALMELYSEIRAEIGTPNPRHVYSEARDWRGFSGSQ